MQIRHAEEKDLQEIISIYDAIHSEEEAGRSTIGWQRNIYPTAATAQAALSAGELYVLEDSAGRIAASVRINRQEMPAYAQIPWVHPEEPVLVMHTLTVDPAFRGLGYGKALESFYEALAKSLQIHELRIDTNERNTAARRMYQKLGWQEQGIVPCEFNGIQGVGLVCLEKWLDY